MSKRYRDMSDEVFIAKLKRDMDWQEDWAAVMLTVFGAAVLAILITAAIV